MVGRLSWMESNSSSDNSNCEQSKCESAEDVGDVQTTTDASERGDGSTDATSPDAAHDENGQNSERGLKSILKQKGQYTMRKVNVDFDLIPQRIPFDETKDYTIEIQIVDKEPMKVKSWAALFALKKAEAEAEAAALAEAEAALKKAEEVMKREALKKAHKAKGKKSDKSQQREPKSEDPNSGEVECNAEELHQNKADVNITEIIADEVLAEQLCEVAASLIDDILSETPLVLGLQNEEHCLQEDSTPTSVTSVDEDTQNHHPLLELSQTDATDTSNVQNDEITDDIIPNFGGDSANNSHRDTHSTRFSENIVQIIRERRPDLTKSASLEVASTAVGLLEDIELITSNLIQNGENPVP